MHMTLSHRPSPSVLQAIKHWRREGPGYKANVDRISKKKKRIHYPNLPTGRLFVHTWDGISWRTWEPHQGEDNNWTNHWGWHNLMKVVDESPHFCTVHVLVGLGNLSTSQTIELSVNQGVICTVQSSAVRSIPVLKSCTCTIAICYKSPILNRICLNLCMHFLIKKTMQWFCFVHTSITRNKLLIRHNYRCQIPHAYQVYSY